MKIEYVEIQDKENPKKPKGKNIAKELEKYINEYEEKHNLKFNTCCCLGEIEIPTIAENGIVRHCVNNNKAQSYMLFFI